MSESDNKTEYTEKQQFDLKNTTPQGSDDPKEFIPLDTLLLDFCEDYDTHESEEESKNFESFIADYKKTVSEMLSAEAAAISDKEIKEKTEDAASDAAQSDIKAEQNMIYESSSEADEEALESEEKTEPLLEQNQQSVTISRSTDRDNIDIAFGAVIDLGDDFEEKDDTNESISPDQEASLTDQTSIAATDDGETQQLSIDIQVPEHAESFEDTEPQNTEEETKDRKYDPEKPRLIDNIFEFVELFIFTLAAVLIITSFFFRHSIVDGESMNKTLENGDHIIISNCFYTPSYGDIIVFEDFSTSRPMPLVKRVIGLAGDEITVDYANGSYLVYRNGELLDEPYAYKDGCNAVYTSGSWTVPDGAVFVLGDHRDDSKDSRSFGPVEEEKILGRLLIRFLPFSSFGTVD